MVFSIVFGVAVFGYAGWTIRRHVIKSKEGKCSGCSLGDSCPSASSCSTPSSHTPLRPSKP
ncbi:FeoB-associated Cys-rich membrane protein [Gorillibacterium sp. sgz500922]|uniref:FeoB-associated Cys-rich membrane protein n=1 Tax=Gorillibacterium sp. sgz500922 TaxID=3446694 RepID=UPI003F66C49E